jgi:predicted nucleic acid-binding Zn finger protein
MKKNAWKNYRNRWIYLKGKKVKLRKYIYVSAFYMKSKNRKGWHDVNHVQNYKNALNKYGFAGVKIYEDFFYRDIPLPENRSVWVRLALFLAPYYAKVLTVKYSILKKFKR